MKRLAFFLVAPLWCASLISFAQDQYHVPEWGVSWSLPAGTAQNMDMMYQTFTPACGTESSEGFFPRDAMVGHLVDFGDRPVEAILKDRLHGIYAMWGRLDDVPFLKVQASGDSTFTVNGYQAAWAWKDTKGTDGKLHRTEALIVRRGNNGFWAEATVVKTEGCSPLLDLAQTVAFDPPCEAAFAASLESLVEVLHHYNGDPATLEPHMASVDRMKLLDRPDAETIPDSERIKMEAFFASGFERCQQELNRIHNDETVTNIRPLIQFPVDVGQFAEGMPLVSVFLEYDQAGAPQVTPVFNCVVIGDQVYILRAIQKTD